MTGICRLGLVLSFVQGQPVDLDRFALTTILCWMFIQFLPSVLWSVLDVLFVVRYYLRSREQAKAQKPGATTRAQLKRGADMSFGIPWNFINNEFAAISGDSLAARGHRYEDTRQLRQQEALNDLAIQQEKNSIIGRVDAAKAAGLHPLTVMGAQGLGGPVVSAGGKVTDPGIGYFDTPAERPAERTPEQKRYDTAQADLAELNVELARRRLATQPGNSGSVNELTGNNKVVPAEATPYPVSHVKIEGQTLPPSSSDSPHKTPGTAPGWDVVQIDTGRNPATRGSAQLKLVVPGGSVQRENWGEQLGELPFWLMPKVAQLSAQASGISTSEWIRRVLLGYGGAEAHVQPKYRGGSREVYGPVR